MAVIYEKKEIPVTMKITESTKLILEKICTRQDRPMSYVTRELMLRGLSLFEIDGKLRDEITDEAPKHLAPVVATITPHDPRTIDDEDINQIRKRVGQQRVGMLKEKAK